MIANALYYFTAVNRKLPLPEVPSATAAAECTQAPTAPTVSTSSKQEASSFQPSAAPSQSTLASNVASPSSDAPRQKRKFDAEYRACRDQQDMYHELLMQQTKEEHEQQMKLYQFHREVLQRQLDVFTETCRHIREVVDTCKVKFLDSLGNAGE